MATTPGSLDITFTATLGKVRDGDTWTCVKLPGSAAMFGTRGLVKVAGTIDGEPFRGAFMALGDGTHKLPVTAAIRRAIGKTDGDDVTIHLTERLAEAAGASNPWPCRVVQPAPTTTGAAAPLTGAGHRPPVGSRLGSTAPPWCAARSG